MGNPRKGNGHRRRKLLARLRASDAPCWICLLPIDRTLPAGHPLAMEADELVPVSKGGSPYDAANVAPAHRCCNNWRRTRPAWLVDAIRARVRSACPYSTPEEFVAMAKAAERKAIAKPAAPVAHTTEW